MLINTPRVRLEATPFAGGMEKVHIFWKATRRAYVRLIPASQLSDYINMVCGFHGREA